MRIYIKQIVIFLMLLGVSACTNTPPVEKADYVVVYKSQSKMFLKQDGEIIRSYNIALGENPVGHKVQEGDSRTPEGVYMLNYKNTKSKFYKSINIDYPNDADIARAKLRGVDPGDDIVIHGLPNKLGNYRGFITPKNWTDGCIGVYNHEMDEIWALIDVDTPIEILP